MNNHNIVWVGRHEGMLRDVSRGCAYGDPQCLKQGARILSAWIPNNAILIPMPSHIGYATTMLSLCKWIQGVVNLYSGQKGVVINDCLVCDPHESSHIVKLRNGVAPEIKMYLGKKPPSGGNVYVIDNTVATGVTANAAIDALEKWNIIPTVLAITKG